MSRHSAQRAGRLLLGALVFLTAAQTRGETTGRLSFDMPAAGPWKQIAEYESNVILDGGARTVPLFNKLFQWPADTPNPKALLMVTSTSGSNNNRVRWGDVCPPSRDRLFTMEPGSNKSGRSFECLVVSPAFSVPTFFRDNVPVLQGVAAQGTVLPPVVVSFRSAVALENGTVVRVNLMADRSFAGLKDKPPEAGDTRGVDPAWVAWGESLHAAVKDAAVSPANALRLPPIDFKTK